MAAVVAARILVSPVTTISNSVDFKITAMQSSTMKYNIRSTCVISPPWFKIQSLYQLSHLCGSDIKSLRIWISSGYTARIPRCLHSCNTFRKDNAPQLLDDHFKSFIKCLVILYLCWYIYIYIFIYIHLETYIYLDTWAILISLCCWYYFTNRYNNLIGPWNITRMWVMPLMILSFFMVVIFTIQ